jgi:hypothetical protein
VADGNWFWHMVWATYLHFVFDVHGRIFFQCVFMNITVVHMLIYWRRIGSFILTVLELNCVRFKKKKKN